MKFDKVDNKFKGKRCFILGSAPSILEEDLSLLQNDYVMTLNNSFQLIDYGLKKYQFYNVNDPVSYKELYKKIKTDISKDIIKFYPQNWLENKPHGYPLTEDFIVYNNNRINLFTGEEELLSDNIIPNNFYEGWNDGGSSVIFNSTLICHFMGFEEIYWLGADFYKEPDKVTHFFGKRKRGKRHFEKNELKFKNIIKNLSSMLTLKNKKFVNLSRGFKFTDCMETDTLSHII